MSIYEELRGWQAGIGSLVGLVALLLGALWNFHLNRRRDKALRREEVLSVEVALYGEILLLRNEVALIARLVANHHIQGREIGPQFLQERRLSPSFPLPDTTNPLQRLAMAVESHPKRSHVI